MPKQPTKGEEKGNEQAQPVNGRSIFDTVGIDAICNDLTGGDSMTAIAKKHGVTVHALVVWIAGDVTRSARVREARTEAAKLWDELATDGIQNATDPFELAKAKEIAHHYRWRASKIAPKEYGDKIDHDIKHSGQIAMTITPEDAGIL